jgi:hypothetical protein
MDKTAQKGRARLEGTGFPCPCPVPGAVPRAWGVAKGHFC